MKALTLVTAAALLGLSLPASASMRVTLIGVVTAQADRRCTGKMEPDWLNPHHQVGFVRITASKQDLTPYEGKPVIVTGRIANVLPPKITHTGHCMEAQMRSDWVVGKNGMRIRRAAGVGFAAMSVDTVTPLTGFAASRKDKKLSVRFTNPTAASLGTVSMIIHYEGCYGKPGTLSESSETKAVARGKTATVSVPINLERKRGQRLRRYRAASASVRISDTKGITSNLTMSLSAIGGGHFDCPKRGRP